MKNTNQLLTEEIHDFESLISIMSILRGEDGCPWDKEQTHLSIRKCLIEETYEVVDAIDRNDPVSLKEELGDLIFQAVFHSKIEAEAGNFTIDDVVNDICSKMISRHPHVFKDSNHLDNYAIQQNWDEIKIKEKNLDSIVDSLKNIPPQLPSLLKAQKVHKKVRSKLNHGFINKKEALNYAKSKIDDSVTEAIFALAAAAELDDIDIEMELNSFVSDYIECL